MKMQDSRSQSFSAGGRDNRRLLVAAMGTAARDQPCAVVLFDGLIGHAHPASYLIGDRAAGIEIIRAQTFRIGAHCDDRRIPRRRHVVAVRRDWSQNGAQQNGKGS